MSEKKLSEAIPFSEIKNAIKRIVDKVNLPVSADLEAGYGSTIEHIVENAKKLIEIRVVGINLEDSIKMSSDLVDAHEFVEKISAIRQMANHLGIHLVINARTDVFITKSRKKDERLNESIKRGNLYRKAGADCIFIPKVMEKEKIRTLVDKINAPINISVNPTIGTGYPPTIKKLRKLGLLV